MCDVSPLAMFFIDCFSNCNGVKTYDIDVIDEHGRVNIISIIILVMISSVVLAFKLIFVFFNFRVWRCFET